MIEHLIAELGEKLDLTAKELADVIWLTLIRQEGTSINNGGLEPERNISEIVEQDKTPEPIRSLLSSPEPDNKQPSPVEPVVGITSHRSSTTNTLMDQLPFKVANPPSLRNPMALARALRPLMQQVPSGRVEGLDEQATAQQIAEAGIWQPIVKPILEPWLEIALVADEGASMLIWRQTVLEFRKLLRNYGAFRDVQLWGLHCEGDHLGLRPGIGSDALHKPTRQPEELVDPSGRRLILLITDCVSSYWQEEILTKTLKLWAQQSPIAIIQVLPEWLWVRTAIRGFEPVQLAGLEPGVSNSQLVVDWSSVWMSVTEPQDGVCLPIVPLEPDSVLTWSQMVMGQRQAPGYWIRAFPTETNLPTIATQSPAQQLERFKIISSPMAQRLMGLVAASPVITLPVIRLIQETLLPKSQQMHVAEVLLGGLLEPIAPPHPGVVPDEMEYRFINEVTRDLLLEETPVPDTIQVLSSYVERQFDRSLDEFVAELQLLSENEDLDLVSKARSFARVTTTVLKRKGGKYREFVQQIEQQYRDSQEASSTGSQIHVNSTLMQWFHWYIPADGKHWKNLQAEAANLAKAGITALWLPPACKANGGGYDVGYGIYDLFDLGEFDQKGTIPTKYGTKDEYAAAVHAVRQAGMQAYADVVFNHKMGADAEEEFDVIPVDSNDPNSPIGDTQTIKSWTNFFFPGRGDKYSSMKWHWWHFDAVDYNSYNPSSRTVYRINYREVALSQNNFSYLMGCDLDMNHPEVRGELKYWGEWLLREVGADGFRLDAIKYINAEFLNDWLDHLKHVTERDLFCVGEYWTEDMAKLSWYIGNAGGRMSLFDVPLHYNFHRASRSGGSYDMQKILDDTLMKNLPLFAVTFVDDHNTQPLQALESTVESWFKPLAYAIILLRTEGYPCVFYADYYGAHYKDRGLDGNEHEIWMDSHKTILDRFLSARINFAYGPQYDYFDHPNVIGWTRLGSQQHPGALAVILSNDMPGSKWMDVGKPNATFVDITEHIKDPIGTNNDGWGEFRCNGGSVSVWVQIEYLKR